MTTEMTFSKLYAHLDSLFSGRLSKIGHWHKIGTDRVRHPVEGFYLKRSGDDVFGTVMSVGCFNGQNVFIVSMDSMMGQSVIVSMKATAEQVIEFASAFMEMA